MRQIHYQHCLALLCKWSVPPFLANKQNSQRKLDVGFLVQHHGAPLPSSTQRTIDKLVVEMQNIIPTMFYRATVAVGRFHGRYSLRPWSFSIMPSRDKHLRCFRSSSGVAKIQEEFRNDHVAARTLSATTKDASIQDLFGWSRQAYPEKWRQECWYLTTVCLPTYTETFAD